MSIAEILAERVSIWERLGHPSLLERFVLRNGKVYTPRKRIGHRRKAGECYGNATKHVLNNDGVYVEGFVMIPDIALPLQHAWVTINGDDAMDPTLDAMAHEYYGVAFDRKILGREIVSNGYYGLLDSGLGLNTKLMFGMDPELKEICEQVQRNRRRA
jgi:hypothetical protein